MQLEFKLFLKGRFCGYEKHTISKDMPYLGLEILHSYDGENWKHAYGGIRAASTHWRTHDEKRQWTGYKDKKGEKIYFGDKIKHPEDNLICTVELSHGQIFAKHPVMSPGFSSVLFKNMEIVEEVKND